MAAPRLVQKPIGRLELLADRVAIRTSHAKDAIRVENVADRGFFTRDNRIEIVA